MSPESMLILVTSFASSLLYWVVPSAAVRIALRRALRGGRRVLNYRGTPVTLGLGWAWVAWGVVAALPALTAPVRAGGQGDAGVLVAGVALLGWLDDRHGTAAARGFSGHLGALRRGHVTTGLLKLVGVAGLALAVSYALPGARADTPAGWPARVVVWVTCAGVIALAANLVNLLDLRPGRALKAYLAMALPAYAVFAGMGVRPGWHWTPQLVLIVALGSLFVLGPALACWGADVRERAMLGDMGANAAGALAGWLLARVLPLPALAAAAAILLALNLASERVSFSRVIANSPPLAWLDGLGRARETDTVGEGSVEDAGS